MPAAVISGTYTPPVGGDDYLMALALQLLGQFHNVGFRPADVQAHSGHQNLHSALPCHTSVTTPVKEAYLV